MPRKSNPGGFVLEHEVDSEVAREPLKDRIGRILDRAENIYLKLLRAIILVIATGLVAYAVFLSMISIYRILQSPESVQEVVASVSPEELATASPTPSPAQSSAGPRDNPAHRRAYEGFLSEYYQLFQRRFEPFRQGEDRPLSRQEFGDRFLGIPARLVAIREGDLSFESDMTDLRSLLQAVSAAAGLPETQRRLRRYKTARKVQVCQNVERTRTTYVEGWDRYSMACSTWYENLGCAVRRPVQTPYTNRECAMRFPDGTQSHVQIFRAYQDRFFQLLTERRTANAARAQSERQDIIDGILQGRLSLWTALLLMAGFLVLMFFFLLIAIERHQRRTAAGSR